MKLTGTCLIVMLVLGSTAAVGQVIYNSASTAAEGYQRGLSGVISAQGQRNVSNSQAAINLTDARSNQIDNQLKSVNAFLGKKRYLQPACAREDDANRAEACVLLAKARFEAAHSRAI